MDPTTLNALEQQTRVVFEGHAERLKKGASQHPGIDGFAGEFEVVQDALRPFPLEKMPPEISQTTLQPYFKDLFLTRHLGPLLDWFLQEVRANQYMIEVDIAHFMAEYEEKQAPDVVYRLLQRVWEWWEAWGRYVHFFNQYLEGSSSYRRVCSVHLNAALPPSFRAAFRALILSTFPDGNDDPDSAAERRRRAKSIFSLLANLGLLTDHEHFVGSILKEFVTNHLNETCAGEWSRPLWGEMKEWFSRVIVPWIKLAYTRSWMKGPDQAAIIDPVATKYNWHMCETLARLRISEIFDIIVDYPESTPALNDLKECLFHTGTRNELVDSLLSSTKRRLLHPGADTVDIIRQYISTIRCLRILDPIGALLFSVADPIRQYLRERPDTIRTIVQNLIEPKGEFALGEDDGDVKPLQDTHHMADDYADFSWMPEPSDADAAFRYTRQADIISTLVSIYDSKEVFVKELQLLFGKRLVEITNDDYDAEIRNLEILKLRFGDAPLQVCDVMMKDVMDSKRSNQQIQRAQTDLPPITTTIISRLFWPNMFSGQLSMPGQFRKFQEEYAKAFSTLKPDRKIRFISTAGTMTLDLEFEDRKLSVPGVTPLQASIVELFSDKAVWSTDELAEKLGGVDIPSIDKAMEFWMDHGVVKPLGNKQYQVLEIAEEPNLAMARQVRRAAAVEDPATSIQTAEQQQAEQMRVYWQFIQGMLKNFGTLPTDRIHTMLRFAPNYDRTREQLAMFMEALKREGLVDFSDGMWRLHR